MAFKTDNTKYRLPAGQYVAEDTPKSMVCLHYTAGTTVSGAVQSWAASPERVATAYVVDLDGTRYEIFPPGQWAWHLGCSVRTVEQRSIGIEIVNVGPLVRHGDGLFWWPENYNRYRYCDLADTAKYVVKSYRGFAYHAAFTPEQKQSVKELVVGLCEQFKIPMVYEKEMIGVCKLPFFRGYKGIAGHENFLAGKTDPGPAWDWSVLDVSDSLGGNLGTAKQIDVSGSG
jgi:N-acetyl-anhydromuramyl-L-alanine amidase AmpD